MYNYEHTPPVEWFTSHKRPRSSHYPRPMSRPVSKSFNRISDFIFPDTIHVRLQHQQQPPPISRRYHRAENYSLPILNRHPMAQRDFIVIERLPADELDNIDLLYREQYYQPNRPIRRRYSSVIDERRTLFDDKKSPTGLPNRSNIYRERIRDRRKRHTTDNVYHSMLKSMLEEEEDEQEYTNNDDPNYILRYRTNLEPIIDDESMVSVQQQHINDISLEEWKRQTHCRVPINGTVPIMTERERKKQRQQSSSLSSRDSSTDTDITERHPIITNYTHYQQNSSCNNSSKSPPVIWERLPSNPIHLQQQPDRYIPIIASSTVDTNNQETMSYSNNLITSSPFDNVINYQINNRTSSQDSTHHVSVCVNDLHTTLFIDEDALNSPKTMIDNNTNGKVHIRKRNTLVSGSIVTEDYHSRRKNKIIDQQNTSWLPSSDVADENKLVRPYFLIRPQTILVLPNETAKFKCCFGGDPLPTIIWSHNESRVSELLTTGGTISSRYRAHKLHDIYYLDIGSVNLRDNGQIKCTIMNKFGREEVIVQLLVVPSPADATPCIAQSLNDVLITEGQPLTLSCGINGLQVTINWFHNGKLISSITQSKSDYNDENVVFTLSRCMRTDAGTVDCLVKNRFGEARSCCRIEVINDPEFDR